MRKIQANPALEGQMRELQRLPTGDASRQRRLAAIDRAIQQYLPDVAREELRQAGVQATASAAAKRAKVDAQIDATKKTEPKGSTGPAAGKLGAKRQVRPLTRPKRSGTRLTPAGPSTTSRKNRFFRACCS